MSNDYGVRAVAAPARGPAPVEAPDLTNVAFIGYSNRQFRTPVVCQGGQDAAQIFGEPLTDWYLNSLVQGFYDNTRDTHTNVWIKTFSPDDAVSAALSIVDSGASPTIEFIDSYQRSNQEQRIRALGTYGNSTGVTIRHVNKAVTTVRSPGVGPAETIVPVDNPAGMEPGDVVLFEIAGGGEADHKITGVNRQNRTITVTPAVAGHTAGLGVRTVAFRIQPYRKVNGRDVAQNVRIANIDLSLETDSRDYVGKVGYNQFFELRDRNSPTAGFYARFPEERTVPAYMFGGLNGTDPVGASDRSGLLSDEFEGVNLFAVISGEDIGDTATKTIKAWAENRVEQPMFFAFVPYFGSDLQGVADWGGTHVNESDDWHLQTNVYGWRYMPFALDTSRYGSRLVPGHAHVCGAFLEACYGGNLHRAFAEIEFDIKGFTDGPTRIFEDDTIVERRNNGGQTLRSAMLDNGVNVLRTHEGAVRVRNWRTVGTALPYRYAHVWAIEHALLAYFRENFPEFENAQGTTSTEREIRAKMRRVILKPFWEGSAAPFVVAQSSGPNRGAFGDNGDPNSTLEDVTRVVFTTPGSGQRLVDVEWDYYDPIERLTFRITTRLNGSGV